MSLFSNEKKPYVYEVSMGFVDELTPVTYAHPSGDVIQLGTTSKTVFTTVTFSLSQAKLDCDIFVSTRKAQEPETTSELEVRTVTRVFESQSQLFPNLERISQQLRKP